ncbi:hypothetical protein DMUE_0095 [Dictyocoela muelleri]|nr:hypothetical protein DMUE_0095 [Dictyocoela muelleri]
MQEIKIIKSQKEKNQLIFSGFIYNQQKITENYIYWHSVRQNCSGRLHTDILNQSILYQASHWHEKESGKIGRLKVNNIIKKTLGENKLVFNDAIIESCRDLDNEEKKLIGSRDN